MVDAVGGPARARVITLLACVLALNSADTSTIGAVAPQLKVALGINNAQIGLLSSVTLLVGAVFVIPFGLLVDRAKRVPMLAVSVVLWSAASMLSAIAGSYETLLADAPVDGGRHRDRRARDRVAHRRLLPLARARPHLRLHPRRRDRRDGDRLHDQRLRREPALLAGRVHPDRDPRLLPRRDRCSAPCPSPGAAARAASPRASSTFTPRSPASTPTGRGRRGRPTPRRRSPTRRSAIAASRPIRSWCCARTRRGWASSPPRATCSRSRRTGC